MKDQPTTFWGRLYDRLFPVKTVHYNVGRVIVTFKVEGLETPQTRTVTGWASYMGSTFGIVGMIADDAAHDLFRNYKSQFVVPDSGVPFPVSRIVSMSLERQAHYVALEVPRSFDIKGYKHISLEIVDLGQTA